MTPPSPEMVERAIRETLWIGHGHVGLYGDDGEMQCSRCRADYKRDALDILARVALTAAHAQGRAKGLEEAAKTCREESDHWNPYGRVVENETVQTRQQARAQMAMELGARFRRAAEEARRG